MDNKCANADCRFNKQNVCLKNTCSRCALWQEYVDFFEDDLKIQSMPQILTDEELAEIDEKIKELMSSPE